MTREREANRIRSTIRSLAPGFLWAAVFLQSAVVHAQIEDLVAINTLTPAASGGCYPGTTGTDATMFIRAYPGAQGCNLFNLNPDLCLARKEFPADGANGRAVSFSDMDQLRPSVYGDGSVVFFANNIDLCVMLTSSFQQEACYSLPPSFFVHSIAVQPQGTLLGMVPRDLNNIDVPANAIQIFSIGNYPSLPLLATYQFNNPLIFPDSIDFMARGAWILFDASTTQAVGGQWGLYLVNASTQQLHLLAPPVPGYELRNPVFGQTSDDVIAFEAVNTSTGSSTILTADLLTGEVRNIAEIGITTGIPTFNGDDTAIIFNREDAGAFSTVSLRRRTLLVDRITPFGPETLHIENGGYATIYRRGTFDSSALSCPEPTAIAGLVPSVLALATLARRRRSIREGGIQASGSGTLA